MDFECARKLLNNYNQKNLNKFLESKPNCLLTAIYLKKACFVKDPRPLKQTKSECLKQKDVNPFKLKREAEFLYDLCLKNLPACTAQRIENAFFE